MTSHRKTSVLARKRNLNTAIAPLVEKLEERQLLAAVTGPITIDYRYPQAADNEWGHIVVSQGVTAEFLFVNVSEDTGAIVDVTETPIPPGVRPDGAPVVSSYLYAVYVSGAVSSSANPSFISVTYQRQEPGNLVTDPYADAAPGYRVTNAHDGTGVDISPAGDTGKLLLGALGKTPDFSYPITTVKPTVPFGPYKITDDVTAGLTVADGQELGKFLFGGTVLGQVTIGGSMDLFYAGQLLTGTATGLTRGAAPRNPNNFYVKGDLRDLIVKAAIGTNADGELNDPTYLTGFDLKVDGRLGQVRSYDSFVGAAHVVGGAGTSQLTGFQNEVETRGAGAGGLFLGGFLGNGTFFNDTFETAQFLGSINYTYKDAQNKDVVDNNSVYIRGELDAVNGNNNNDWFDYYGVALDAGQTVEVQMTDGFGQSPTGQMLRVGVFDPDGREIASDYSDVDPKVTSGAPFRFKADRPGVYRFAVATDGDSDFATHAYSAGQIPYLLRMSNVGNITLGGVVATNNVYDFNSIGIGVNVENGDLGAIYGGGNVMSRKSSLSLVTEDTNGNYRLDPGEDTNNDGMLQTLRMGVWVANGNLRTLQGGTVGVRGQDNSFGAGFDLHVPNGSVGLVRATADLLDLNPLYSNMYGFFSVAPVLGDLTGMPYVGGDYQVISSATLFYGNVVATKKLGTLRAGDMATRSPSVIAVNADLSDDADGVIDLIDIAGDLGTVQAGGPAIYTGPSGNVRYINVGGNIFGDRAFGGGSPQGTTFTPGETALFNDDSGSLVTLSPNGPGQLTVWTYGIRGSGGVAVIRVDCTGSIYVSATPQYSAATAEIGRINITSTDPAGTNPSVNITGTARADVFEITGGDFTNIINNTTGELVNITGGSATSIQAETIGLAKATTEAAVNSVTVRSDAYPFSQQRILVNMSGTIGLISARGALGNISAGTITKLVADSDKIRATGTYDGIVGPIYATGTLGDIDIGAGIAWAGRGNAAYAGVFAEGAITTVHGSAADIRGIVASNTSIATIQLISGSLIDANIFVGQLADAREISLGWRMSNNGGTISNPTYEIGQILIQGGGSTSPGPGPGPGPGPTPTPNPRKKQKYVWVNVRGKWKKVAAAPKAAAAPVAAAAATTGLSSGIIGTAIGASDIGTVKVTGGFGIIDSYMGTLGNGVVDRVEADGYGLRDLWIHGGAKFNNIIAVGTGAQLPVTSCSTSVRQSETLAWDPYTGFNPNELTDLYVYLNRSGVDRITGNRIFTLAKDKPTYEGVTNTGINSNMSVQASREVGLIQAWRLEANGWGNQARTMYEGFNVANIIRNINIANDINGVVNPNLMLVGVRILTGAVPAFYVGRNVTGLNMTVAGPIGPLVIGGDVDATTRIFASGPSGTISSIKIGGSFAGWIRAQYDIPDAPGTIVIGKSPWTGQIWDGKKLRTK